MMRTTKIWVHSVGSVWLEKKRPDGRTSVWNTTGISDGRLLRPRAVAFGQISLGRQARLDWAAKGELRTGMWIARPLNEHGGIRRVELICRAAPEELPDWYMAIVTERSVGAIHTRAMDEELVQLVSHSAWRGREEMLLLLKPFAVISGDSGTATLIPKVHGCAWRTEEWVTR